MKDNLKNIADEVIAAVGSAAKSAGIDVYIVGGYVRNEIMGLSSNDMDFLVMGDAPEFSGIVSERLGASKPLKYGACGTAYLWYGGLKAGFVSPRAEEYSPDSRKPKVSEAALFEDLQRRDFTINTLAKKINGGQDIIDPFGGIEDISNKVIKTPSDAEASFTDDPLRMLRAARFAGQFDFTIEQKAFEAVKKVKERIGIVSTERISNELMLILSQKHPSTAFKLLKYSGLLEIIFPEIDRLSGVENQDGYLHKDVFYHTLKVVDNVCGKSDNINLRFTALMHDVAKPMTKKFYKDAGWTFYGHDELGARVVKSIVKRLKLPKGLSEYARKLIRMHLRPISLSEEHVTDSAIRRFIVEAGDCLDDLMTLCRADITSGNPDRAAKHLENFARVERRVGEVIEKDKLRAFKSPVDGNEIMKACNLEPGKKIGILKKKIEDAILDGEIPNEHDAAFEYLMKIKDEVTEE